MAKCFCEVMADSAMIGDTSNGEKKAVPIRSGIVSEIKGSTFLLILICGSPCFAAIHLKREMDILPSFAS